MKCDTIIRSAVCAVVLLLLAVTGRGDVIFDDDFSAPTNAWQNGRAFIEPADPGSAWFIATNEWGDVYTRSAFPLSTTGLVKVVMEATPAGVYTLQAMQWEGSNELSTIVLDKDATFTGVRCYHFDEYVWSNITDAIQFRFWVANAESPTARIDRFTYYSSPVSVRVAHENFTNVDDWVFCGGVKIVTNAAGAYNTAIGTGGPDTKAFMHDAFTLEPEGNIELRIRNVSSGGIGPHVHFVTNGAYKGETTFFPTLDRPGVYVQETAGWTSQADAVQIGFWTAGPMTTVELESIIYRRESEPIIYFDDTFEDLSQWSTWDVVLSNLPSGHVMAYNTTNEARFFMQEGRYSLSPDGQVLIDVFEVVGGDYTLAFMEFGSNMEWLAEQDISPPHSTIEGDQIFDLSCTAWTSTTRCVAAKMWLSPYAEIEFSRIAYSNEEIPEPGVVVIGVLAALMWMVKKGMMQRL